MKRLTFGLCLLLVFLGAMMPTVASANGGDIIGVTKAVTVKAVNGVGYMPGNPWASYTIGDIMAQLEREGYALARWSVSPADGAIFYTFTKFAAALSVPSVLQSLTVLPMLSFLPSPGWYLGQISPGYNWWEPLPVGGC